MGSRGNPRFNKIDFSQQIYIFFIKINFITSKQTITITRTVQLLMHDTKSDEEMDYKKRITERVEPNRP